MSDAAAHIWMASARINGYRSSFDLGCCDGGVVGLDDVGIVEVVEVQETVEGVVGEELGVDGAVKIRGRDRYRHGRRHRRARHQRHRRRRPRRRKRPQ